MHIPAASIMIRGQRQGGHDRKEMKKADLRQAA
jgi:hypothetical protein